MPKRSFLQAATSADTILLSKGNAVPPGTSRLMTPTMHIECGRSPFNEEHPLMRAVSGYLRVPRRRPDVRFGNEGDSTARNSLGEKSFARCKLVKRATA